MKTARERADEKRAEKLKMIDEQIEDGRLIVREMTAEERARYPVRQDAPQGKPKRRY
jgi:hypothetical protein